MNVANQADATPQGRGVSLGEHMCEMPHMCVLSCMRSKH
ncbi:hypothetical protein FHS44_002645 [Streptosporangium saharense]|uniref:Uncharacterized protein n=1 Tax=Streptosporangium saharense TaxID=1706840 RepID=A0A7W7QL18_9ACTN|nr:hypothetical protein [Streptosporangium saharense]